MKLSTKIDHTIEWNSVDICDLLPKYVYAMVGNILRASAFTFGPPVSIYIVYSRMPWTKYSLTKMKSLIFVSLQIYKYRRNVQVGRCLSARHDLNLKNQMTLSRQELFVLRCSKKFRLQCQMTNQRLSGRHQDEKWRISSKFRFLTPKNFSFLDFSFNSNSIKSLKLFFLESLGNEEFI